jgi:Sulfotransferase family
VRTTLVAPATYPETVPLFSGEQFRHLGDEYLARLEALTAGRSALRITDKMPGNFTAIGLIRLALPNARIIHTIRDPVDTCLSCFSKLFSEVQPFTYDLGELGRYYRAYARLMQHWRRILPEVAFLDVRYEELVADFENQARRILDYCGLRWNDACLSYEADRRVKTASQVQVRQPIYRSSVGRWRPDDATLRPLIDGLDNDIRMASSGELIGRNGGFGNRSPLPVFIVGMPRSGSTLVEQILASHSRVFGGGERSDLTAAMKSIGVDIAAPSFPESVAGLTGAQLARLGADYVDRLQAAARSLGIATAERITDKMPANSCFVGLIHLALPNARIIHTRRDPIDTCLSCFAKLFGAEQPFAYDLGELGRYHRACDALMEHWRRVLPPEVVLDVQYEELVANFEPQARRIVAHCGLDWDDACLSFHKTERVVRTASVTQVRQPIYRTSIGRWRPADDVLRPLLDALDLDSPRESFWMSKK